MEKFPGNTLFRGKQLVRRILDAASAEEESDAAAELERITRDDPALALEFHSVLYDSAVRRGDVEHSGHLLAARESAKKRVAEMKRGNKNPIVDALRLVGMLVLLPLEGSLLILLLTKGRYGFWGYFIGGAHIAVFCCWVAIQYRKDKRERKAEIAPATATPFDDTGMFPSPEPEAAPPVDIKLGGFRLSPNRLFGALFVLLMLAGIFHIVRTERDLDRIMEAAMTAYEAKDYETAARHIRAAAERNDAGAQCMLGVFYAEGRGVEQDYAEAVKWFRKAARDSKYRKGISGAKRRLGDCYFHGRGVERDLNEAAKWYRMAAEQGDEEAEAALERLEAQRAGP